MTKSHHHHAKGRTPSRLRIMTYSHDSYGLGHLRRSVNIAAALVQQDRNAQVLCVSGSPVPDLFPLPGRTELLKLPSIGKDADGNYRSRLLPLSFAEIAQLRGDLIAAAVRAFRPDLLLVDHTASGPGDELATALDLLRREQPRTRVVLGLRDVLDAPARARSEIAANGTFARIRSSYDLVLVYGHREVFDVVAEYGMPADVAARVRYVGAVVPVSATLRPRHRVASPPRLLFTAGGGEDGGQLLLDAAAALRSAMAGLDVAATFVAGPLAPEDEFLRLARALQDDRRCRLIRSSRGMEQLTAQADLVVGMGGYNTVYETLANGARLLAVPRRGPRQEQDERCRRLHDLGLLSMLTADDARDPARFGAAIASALQSRTLSGPLTFLGARIAADHCLSAAADRQQAIAIVP
jgi:predicted glycosyltransferase